MINKKGDESLRYSIIICLVFFSFFSYGQQTYRDNFGSVSYSNNNGTNNFTGNWIESGDDNAAASGYIRITGGELRFRYLWSETIRRSANLTGASSATLSFDWQTSSLESGETLVVQASSNGTTFTNLATYSGNTSGTESIDITTYISTNTTIRFRKGGGNWSGNDDTAYIDNFQIATIAAPVVPTMTVDDVAVNEGAGTATFTVTHDGVSTAGSFTVSYSTANISANAGSDYTANSGTLTFNGTVGDTEQIVIDILEDFIFEPDETYRIQFTGTSNGTVDISDTAIGTIEDNENDPNAPRPYEERVAMNLKGNFKMRGNTNLRCVSGCPGSPTTNNGVNMGYADVDVDPSTVNSSSSNITIPAGAMVEWAGLYWGGMYNSTRGGITNPPGTLNIDQVKLREPGAASYTTINAQIRNIETASQSNWRSFLAHADITSMVQSGGNGNYFVADIALATGNAYTGPYGGWTMVVIYSDPTEKTRRINVWDGFDFFGFGANDSFNVTGLLTPGSGTFETHAGYFAFDGEASSTGDFVSINNTQLSNGQNPNNNTLNGTISEYGADVGGRNPNFSYNWGMDVDIFDASGTVANGATDLDVDLGSSNEGIWGGVFVVSNEVAYPAVSSKDFNPTVSFPGDESRVTITIENPSGGVFLTNFSLTDNLPSGMTISDTPNATSSRFGIITANAGATSFNISGVILPAGSNLVISFDVVTDDYGVYLNTIVPSDISNNQNIPLSGESSGTLTVKIKTVITNRRITHRVDKN